MNRFLSRVYAYRRSPSLLLLPNIAICRDCIAILLWVQLAPFAVLGPSMCFCSIGCRNLLPSLQISVNVLPAPFLPWTVYGIIHFPVEWLVLQGFVTTYFPLQQRPFCWHCCRLGTLRLNTSDISRSLPRMLGVVFSTMILRGNAGSHADGVD